jgi:hypothetical protein
VRPSLQLAGITAVGLVAACSKPAPQDHPTEATASRTIALVQPVEPAVAVVSRLEARNPTPPAVVRRTDATLNARATRGKPPAADPMALEHSPEISRTTSSVSAERLTLANAPMVDEPVVVFATTHPVGQVEAMTGPGPVSRGPAITLRGGSGNPHDPCALHGHQGRPGVAINTVMPAIGGIGLTNGGVARVGRNGGLGGSRSLRGGIR